MSTRDDLLPSVSAWLSTDWTQGDEIAHLRAGPWGARGRHQLADGAALFAALALKAARALTFLHISPLHTLIFGPFPMQRCDWLRAGGSSLGGT